MGVLIPFFALMIAAVIELCAVVGTTKEDPGLAMVAIMLPLCVLMLGAFVWIESEDQIAKDSVVASGFGVMTGVAVGLLMKVFG